MKNIQDISKEWPPNSSLWFYQHKIISHEK